MFVIVERIGPRCGSVRRSCESGAPARSGSRL